MDAPYLVVDLDDTLVRTDTLFDILIKSLRRNPWLLITLPFILLSKGRSEFKNVLSSQASIDPQTLPFRDSVLEICREFREISPGNKIILASAADNQIVQAVADKLGIFDIVCGSHPGLNLKGENKLERIQQETKSARFIYAGDSKADLPIWKESAGAILVNPSRTVLEKVKKLGIHYEVLRDLPRPWGLILKQMRVHQWVKNSLVFLPFLAAHQVTNKSAWFNGFLAFLAFSSTASAVYVMNDLADVEADRRHPSKCKRPFASGDLPLKYGFLLAPFLLLVSVLLTSLLPWEFAVIIGVYLALNLVYSLKFKEQIIFDVILLGSFYTLRILAGGYATDVALSSWLLSFSTFFFFGLAMVKRYTELVKMPKSKVNPYGRGYRPDDALPVFALGVGSSLLSLLVVCLYFNSPDIARLYHNAKPMWLLVPILLFWTGRLWVLAHRGEIHDDPVVFAIKDKVSWWIALSFGLVLLLSL